MDNPDITVPNSIKQSSYNWCLKYRSLLEGIEADEAIKDSLRKFSSYSRPTGHLEIIKELHDCMHQAYESGVVVKNYWEIIESTGILKEAIGEPSSEWAKSLTEEQLLACIAWHFRRDYFSNGSLICDSVANGYILIYAKEYLKKYHEDRQN